MNVCYLVIISEDNLIGFKTCEFNLSEKFYMVDVEVYGGHLKKFNVFKIVLAKKYLLFCPYMRERFHNSIANQS